MARRQFRQFSAPPASSINSLKECLKLYYGKCERGQHIGSAFINIPRGDGHHIEDDHPWYQFEKPGVETTYIVPLHYMSEQYFQMWGRDHREWANVAIDTIEGAWCAYYETTWNHVPLFEHTTPRGVQMKYGYCRTQSPSWPERDLWFVALNIDTFGHTFVVDEICTAKENLNILGSDWEHRWGWVAWAHLTTEVDWNTLGKPGDFSIVRRESNFQVIRPRKYVEVADIQQFLNSLR